MFIDDQTGSFDGKKSLCFVTWDAIFQIADMDDNGGIWPDSMPDDLEFKNPVDQATAEGTRN
jgi:hypothetical protein